MTHKDLDALLWDWASQLLQAHDSGYPSDYTLRQRVDSGVFYTPNYFPNHRINKLAFAIQELEERMRNIIAGKYLYNMEIKQLAKHLDVHRATVYRDLETARGKLLDAMRHIS